MRRSGYTDEPPVVLPLESADSVYQGLQNRYLRLRPETMSLSQEFRSVQKPTKYLVQKSGNQLRMITLTRFGVKNQSSPCAALIQNASASATEACNVDPDVNLKAASCCLLRDRSCSCRWGWFEGMEWTSLSRSFWSQTKLMYSWIIAQLWL